MQNNFSGENTQDTFNNQGNNSFNQGNSSFNIWNNQPIEQQYHNQYEGQPIADNFMPNEEQNE